VRTCERYVSLRSLVDQSFLSRVCVEDLVRLLCPYGLKGQNHLSVSYFV
jgi:hypothetical protein